MHLNLSFPANVEIGAVRILSQDSLDIETTDGGLEVRNIRASDEPRSWQIAMPTIDTTGTTTDYDAVVTMWGTGPTGSQRGLYSFNFTDPVDSTVYSVRFASALQITAPAPHLRHIDTFTVKQVLETGPGVTVAPAITGTLTVGSTLTVSNGTWTGSPTGYTYQWLRDGVEIASATAATYVLVSGDSTHMIGCAVIATDANGGSTKTFAVAVGPIV